MRWDDLYIAGLGSYLPEQVYTTQQAVAAGRYDAESRVACGYQSVRIADDHEGPAVMGAAAGRQAVLRSGLDSDDFGLVLHAYVGHPGRDVWSPASYVQHETIQGNAPAYDVRQGCNGGLSALELGASYVAARPDVKAALITTGDAFHLPYIDRWTADAQMVFGDGAAALVLSTGGGILKVRSTVSASDSALEAMDRGSGPWTKAPFADGKALDLAARKRDYLASDEFAMDDAIERIAKTSSMVLGKALREAGIDLADARFFVHTTFPETIAQAAVFGALGIDRASTTFDHGLSIGQMGASDQLLGIAHLVDSGLPKPGDLLIASGVGAGHVWTVAVLEFQ